ncbi:hypothetical protein CRU92_04100 [Arcobacter sp. FW59]|nr:hypothetical protein CRU92_04100 [Arcobacter sp. FW59]
MLYNYNNFYSVRRNLIFVNILLLISLISEEKITYINLYFFKIDILKIPFVSNLSDILVILTVYFFIIYYSFLIHNEKKSLLDLNNALFLKLRENKKSIILNIIYPFLTPFLFFIDGLSIKNFAIIFTPYIVTFISIFLYIYITVEQNITYFNLPLKVLLWIFVLNLYISSLDFLIEKYKFNKIKDTKIKQNNLFKEKYKNSKDLLFKRKLKAKDERYR